jgi:ubiquitin-conjugating enzyme E2 D/E
MSNNIQRITNELKEILRSPLHNVSVGSDERNIKHWIGTIIGSENTVIAGGVFKLDICFTNDYPYRAPVIKFITKMYHPNISTSGEICLDMLKDAWCPTLKISHLLQSICSLLVDPNADDPLNPQAATTYKTNRATYNKKVRRYVEKYAII